MIDVKWQSPPRVLLLLRAEFVEVAAQLVENRLGLRNLGMTRQSEPAANHLLLWRGLFLGILLK